MKSKEEFLKYIKRVEKLKVTIDESRVSKDKFENTIDEIIEKVENKSNKNWIKKAGSKEFYSLLLVFYFSLKIKLFLLYNAYLFFK